MRKHILGFTAAIFVVNGMTGSRIFGQSSIDPRQPGANSTVDRAAGAAAGAIVDNGVREQGAVRDALGRAVSATLSSKFSNIATLVTDADKERLGDKLTAQDEQIADQITKFRDAWRNKYNQEFELSSGEIAFAAPGIRIISGDASNANGVARVASERLGNDLDHATSQRPGGELSNAISDANRPAIAQAGDRADKTAHPETAASGSNDGDRQFGNSVIAVLPSSGHLPEVRIPLVRQALGNDWKIDLPDGMDATQLRTNVQRHLSLLMSDTRNWPADVKDGYRMASQHILAGLINPVAMDSSATPAAIQK